MTIVCGGISACAGNADSNAAGSRDTNAMEDAASQFFMYVSYHRPSRGVIGFTLTPPQVDVVGRFDHRLPLVSDRHRIETLEGSQRLNSVHGAPI